MKNDILFILAGGAIALSSVSCSVEENKAAPENDGKVHMVFTSGIATRTALVDDKSVIWSEGDDITIFGGDNNPAPFILTNGAGEAQATFEGDAVEADTYYALYPHYGDASIAGETVSSVLPAEQTYTAGTFAAKLNPSVAKTTGNTLEFKNIAALLKVSVKNLADKTVSSVSVKADDAIAGAYSVDMSGDSYTAAASTEGAREVTLNAEGAAESDYYLVLLPGTHSGMVITVNYSDGSYSQKTASQAIDLSASEIFTLSVDASQAEMPVVEGNLYEKFMAGEDIVIAGKTYNKSQYATEEIRHFTTTASSIYNTSKTNGDGKIFFIDLKDQTAPLSIGNAGDIVVIGVDPENKPHVIRTGSNLAASETGNSRLVLHNLNIDMPNSVNKGSAVNIGFAANSEFGELTLSNCDITMRNDFALIQISSEGTTINELNIIDCNITIPAGTTNRYILTAGTNLYTISKFNLSNNILHCDDGVAQTFRFINSNSNNCLLEINELNISNNILVNLANTNTSAGIVKGLDNVTVTKNLIYFNQSIDAFHSSALYPNFLRPVTGGTYPEMANCTDNISYQLPTDEIKRTFRVFQDNGFTPAAGHVDNTFTKLSVDPFEGGDFSTFTLAPAYSSYGPQQ